MTAAFPGSVRPLTARTDLVNTVFAIDVNSLQEEIAAIETTIGTSNDLYAPLASTYTGTFSQTTTWNTLSERLSNIETGLVNGIGGVGYVPATRTVSTTAPLSGGGALSSNLTLSIAAGTVSAVGVVQLENSTTSTSTTKAATPSSVKTAFDLANAAVPATRTVATTSPLTGGGSLSGNLTLAVNAGTTSAVGVVQLEDSISSTSTTKAATANSVRQAYEAAILNSLDKGFNAFLLAGM